MKIYECCYQFYNGYIPCHYEYNLYLGSDRIGSNAEKYRGNEMIRRSRYSLYHWDTSQFWTKNFVNYAGHKSKLILKRKVVKCYDDIKEVSSIVRMRIPIGCSNMILIQNW